ncbi:MAG: hypothetical protein IJP48_01405 [Synergistaceae bacterium]|nr:hypothetical protein [Synergistaceae bacterium]
MFVAFLKFLMRWTQRLILLAALIALGGWLFYIGREHQIFLDNRTLNGYKALEQVNVSINNGEVSELMTRERGVQKVVGPKFTLKAQVFDEDGNIIQTLEREVKLCILSKDIMINLPVFVSSDRGFIVPAPR